MTFGKKNLRFLLIPFKLSDYDLKQLKKIKKTLKILNVQSQIFDQEYSEEQLKIFLKNNSFDIIFAINKGRPNWLNKKIRFISWFQDFYFDSDSLLENFLESDIVYFYASPEAFEVSKKLNCFTSMLYPGIDDEHKTSIFAQHGENFNLINDYQVLDFSICGYMPCSLLVPHYESHFRNYSFKENHLNDQRINNWFSKLTHKNEKKYSIDIYKEFIVDLQIIVETNYVPLSGDLQVKKIALKIKTNPGEEIICDRLSHIYNYESGGFAFNSACSVRLLNGENGCFEANEVEKNINEDDIHLPVTSLVAVENTCNKGGGSIYSLKSIKEIALVCAIKSLSFHLYGARVFNPIVE